MNAMCKTCPFWKRRANEADQSDPMGFCHHARSYLGPDAIGYRASGWCSEHPLRQRDRLAAMAMQGLAGNWALGGEDPAGRIRGLAKNAYAIADAMLAAAASPLGAPVGESEDGGAK